MPIAADPNIPTVPGYVQVVSFHLLTRAGEKIDIEGAAYTVDNITELDAFLAVTPEPSDGEDELESKPALAAPTVLVKSEYDGSQFDSWRDYKFDKHGALVTGSENPVNTDAWIAFAYGSTFDPTPSLPCHIGYSRYLSFATKVTDDLFGLGDIAPSFKVTLNNSQDANLFTTDTELSIAGIVEDVVDNSTSCVLGSPVFTDFFINGWIFDAAEFPKDEAAPDAKVKLLWLSGYTEV